MTDLQLVLTELLPSVVAVTDAQAVGGGCISDAQCVSVREQAGTIRTLFVKSNRASFLCNFQSEWDGLLRLSEPGAIAVPEPIAVGIAQGRAWLVTEWIEQGQPGKDYFRDFGCQLARFHQSTLGTDIGLERDNFLGSAPQINSRCDSWVDFVASNRIGFQIRWAIDQGLVETPLRRDCERIIRSMEQLLAGREAQTSLLHGDLWSGNYLCNAFGDPVIIDPAIYYGCREAEFGMLRLFGSCPNEFYESYLEAFPLPSGWQRRASVYVLYHLLNHLNLFGSGYHGQCMAVAAEILRQ